MIVPILISASIEYTCAATDSRFKIVQCEHCRYVYVYRMERTLTASVSEGILGDGQAALHAEQLAQGQLSRTLADDCDAVPCLECGKYQEHMVAALKRDFQLERLYYAKLCFALGTVGLVAICLASVYPFVGVALAAAGLLLVLNGYRLIAARKRELSRYHPNATDLAERMQRAARYAKSVDEFRAYLKHYGIDWMLPAHLVRK